MRERFTNKDEFESLKERVAKLEDLQVQLQKLAEGTEKQSIQNRDDIEELRKLLKELQDKLNNKVDSETFDEEINQLK